MYRYPDVEEEEDEEEEEVVPRVKEEELLDLEKAEKRLRSLNKFHFLHLYYNLKCLLILWCHKI